MDHLINIYRPATINRKRSSQLPRVHHDLDPADPIRDRIVWSPTSVFYRRSPNVQSRATVRFYPMILATISRGPRRGIRLILPGAWVNRIDLLIVSRDDRGCGSARRTVRSWSREGDIRDEYRRRRGEGWKLHRENIVCLWPCCCKLTPPPCPWLTNLM